MLETNSSDVENKLNDLIKRLLIAFCEINVTFNTRLDIYGSVHVLSDNLEISSILLNEHSFKKNGIRVENNCDNSLKGETTTTTRMKKRVKNNVSTRFETPDEEELLIEKEWNDPLPTTNAPDIPSTSNTTIRKFNYSNQLISSKSNTRSGRKCKIFSDESSNHLTNLFRNEITGSECTGFLSKFAQGRSLEENESTQPLANESLSTLLEGTIKMDLKGESFANFNSQSIFPEPELICVDGSVVKNFSHDGTCKLGTRHLNDVDLKICEFKERDSMHIKVENESQEMEGMHLIPNHSSKHQGEGLILDAPVGDSCFAQMPDFMMNFLTASKLLRLNSLASTDMIENPEHPFKCLICSSTFSNSLLLQEHFKSHYDGSRLSSSNGNISSLDAPDGPSGLLNSGVSADVVVPEVNKLFCVICNLTFRSLDGLKCHINSKHSLQKTYKCRFCPKLFLTRQAAYSHRVKFHSISIAKK